MLQIVTFNIGGARKLRQPPHNPVKLGQDAAQTLRQVIDPSQPTLIALQETGMITWKSDGRCDVAHDALATALGADYHAHFAAELSSAFQSHARLWTREPYSGMVNAQEGNGFVTNLPFAKWDWDVFPGQREYWTYTQISQAVVYSTGNRNTQPRNLMVVSVEHPTYGALFILNTHYGTLSGEDRHDTNHTRTQEGEARRRFQSQQVLRVVHELREAERTHSKPARPIIFAGDFNAKPEAPSMQDLLTEFMLLEVENPLEDRWTHVTHEILIDHVFVSDPRGVLPPARCFIQTDLPFDDLTDHRPVVALWGT